MFCNSFCNHTVGNCLTKACNQGDNGNMQDAGDQRKGTNEDNRSNVIELPRAKKKKNQRFFELALQGQSWIRKLHVTNWGLNFKTHLENNLDLRRRERDPETKLTPQYSIKEERKFIFTSLFCYFLKKMLNIVMLKTIKRAHYVWISLELTYRL